MRRFFENIILWIYIKIHSIFINISIALYNTEQEILKADPNINDEGSKKVTRKRHRNQLLEKFYAGQRDEKYVQEYYELLKKADKFMRKSTARQIAVAADKHLRFEGHDYSNSNGNEVKDKYGRRYSHFGFFDDNHKHAGKTLGEVLELEMKERRTKDDEYELIYIFNNEPIEAGLSKIFDITKKTGNTIIEEIELGSYKHGNTIVTHVSEFVESDERDEREIIDVWNKSRQFVFPIKAYREDENIVNKIEELTEYLHVKKIAFEIRLLEFFIPLKFKTENVENNSKIFDEITNIKSIFVRNEYGEWVGFGINKFIKRIKYNNTHEVWKFEGIEMESVGLKL